MSTVSWTPKNGATVTRPDGTFYRLLAEGVGNLSAESAGSVPVQGGQLQDVSVTMRRSAGVGRSGGMTVNVFAGGQYKDNLFLREVPSLGTEFATLTGRLDLSKRPDITSLSVALAFYGAAREDSVDLQPTVTVTPVVTEPDRPTPPASTSTGVYQSVPGSGVFSPLRMFLGSIPAEIQPGIRLHEARVIAVPRPTSGRDSLLLGAYEPSAATAGIPDGTNLTTLDAGNLPAGSRLNTTSGILTIDSNDVTLDGFRIPFRVDVIAARARITRSWVQGRGDFASSSSQACVMAVAAGCSGLVIQDSKLQASPSSVYTNGINGHDFTLSRCEVADTVDFGGIFNTFRPGEALNVIIDQNWTHSLAYFLNDPTQGGGPSHCDGFQIQGGLGVKIRGNSLNAFPGSGGTAQPALRGTGISCLLFNDNVGRTGLHEITDNWLRGGDIPVNMRDLTTDGADMGVLLRNKFSGGGTHLSPPLTVYKLGQILDVGAGTADRNTNADGSEIRVRS